MLYSIEFTRNGKAQSTLGSHAQVMAYADYLRRTFRITATIARVAAVQAA